jgi:hypothetical protein
MTLTKFYVFSKAHGKMLTHREICHLFFTKYFIEGNFNEDGSSSDVEFENRDDLNGYDMTEFGDHGSFREFFQALLYQLRDFTKIGKTNEICVRYIDEITPKFVNIANLPKRVEVVPICDSTSNLVYFGADQINETDATEEEEVFMEDEDNLYIGDDCLCCS